MSINRIDSSNRDEFVMMKSRMAFLAFRRLQQSQTSDMWLRYARRFTHLLVAMRVGGCISVRYKGCLCGYQVVENGSLDVSSVITF
jgi:hypothetical protein